MATPVAAATTTATALRKDVMMVHSLQLLGLHAELAASVTSSSVTSAAPAVHAHMFDRPNEKLLFAVLHFLLLKFNPRAEQELKFCWPIITPHDKSNFKRLVQSSLHDLEKQGILPLGSSHASRLNAGSGPRIVDLIWRLSTHAMKAQLSLDFPGYQLVPVPTRNGVDAADAIQLLKARIAMKKRQLQEQFLERSQVQDRWLSSASALSSKIHDTTTRLQQVYDQQSKFDASVSREMFSQAGYSLRQTRLHRVTTAWEAVQGTMAGDTYQSSQRVIDTALQHHGDQPVLDANHLRPQRSFSDRIGAVNLVDIVKNAEALIQLTRSRLTEQDTSLLLSSHDQNRMATLSQEANSYVATLTTTVQQLRELLVQLRRSNEDATRDLCIEMTTESIHDDPTSIPLTLCPPTPADKVLQESDLIQSLKKCSMKELSDFAACSVRKSTRRKSLELPPVLEDDVAISQCEKSVKEKANEEVRVFRKLQYDVDDECGHRMEM